jgi:WD40 repeat protein
MSRLAFAPDGRTLIAGDNEGGLSVWDLPSGRLRTTISRASETGGVWAVAFSPDGQTLATGGDDGLVRLWDPVLFLERATLPGHRAKVHALAFSPTGKALASGDFTGVIRLWWVVDRMAEAGPSPGSSPGTTGTPASIGP